MSETDTNQVLRRKALLFQDLVDNASRLHFRLGALVAHLHQAEELHNGHRAVLRNLVERGPSTVPDLARLRPVARQYIQRLMDDLAARGLVEPRPNPRHKRSRLYVVTEEGRETLRSFLRREAELFRDLIESLDEAGLANAQAFLAQLLDDVADLDPGEG